MKPNKQLPKEVTRARIALLLKKGDAANHANYRPISLLNTLYKTFAMIFKNRIADTLDNKLQKTQYGFRKEKTQHKRYF